MKGRNLREETDISARYSRRLISGHVTATNGIRNPHTLEMVYGAGANRIEVLRELEKQNKFRIIWYVVFLTLGIITFAIEPRGWFNFLDLIVLMINIDLVSQGKVLGIYIGILECFMYIYISFVSGLYGEIIKMAVINIPLNIFSLVSWTRNLKKQKQTSYKSEDSADSGLKIKKLAKRNYWWILLCLVAAWVACYFGLSLLGSGALILSAGVLACTIFQKVLNGMCYKENWWFSIAANIISVAMWIQVIITSSQTGLDLAELPVVVSTLSNLVNGFYGYSLWKSMYRKIAVNGGEVLAKRRVKINRIIKLRRQYQKLLWKREIDISKNS